MVLGMPSPNPLTPELCGENHSGQKKNLDTESEWVWPVPARPFIHQKNYENVVTYDAPWKRDHK